MSAVVATDSINRLLNATPESPKHEQPTLGIVGLGAMGRMYASRLAEAGWNNIVVCDLPEKYPQLKLEFADTPAITVYRDGHQVSRISDWIMYSVEAEHIDSVVAKFGPSTKVGAVVAGQTSVKEPERLAFEKYLPPDVSIVSCHSLHGPTVSPIGQPLVLINHRGSDEALEGVKNILSSFKSRYVYMSYAEHDLVTANTQAVTHAAFLSMGTAWAYSQRYPWEEGKYVGGIETVKVNLMLRIYMNKWHVYAGLAILNPSAKIQIEQYSKSVTEIFKLMLAGEAHAGQELRDRMYSAREKVFGTSTQNPTTTTFLSEQVLDRFSLGQKQSSLLPNSLATTPLSSPAIAGYAFPNMTGGNSHMSLLAMVDCWAALGIAPLRHLELAATPLFRLWLGVASALFLNEKRLDQAITSALNDPSHRSDDLEFVVAARGWSQCVQFGDFELYRKRFETTAKFFESRFEEAGRVGAEMIKVVMQH